MKKNHLYILFVLLLAMVFVAACSGPNPLDPDATQVAPEPTPETIVDGPTPAPQDTEAAPVNDNPNPAGEETTFNPKTADAGSGCEALNDYQLVDLPEISGATNYFLHVEYGQDGVEYETLLPPGRYSVVKPFTSGHVWELGPNCSAEQALRKHVYPNHLRRVERLVNNKGYVHFSDLIKNGMIEVVWQQSPVPDVPKGIDLDVTDEVDAALDKPKGDAEHIADLVPGETVGPFDGVVVLEPWADAGLIDGHTQITLVLPEGEAVDNPTWQGGAVWSFPGWTLDEVLQHERSKQGGFPLYVVESGRMVTDK